MSVSQSSPPAVGDVDTCATPADAHPRRVAAVRPLLPDAEEAARLGEVFRLLGDSTRMRILYALLESGELCVCDLAAAVEVPDSTVSHALRLLRTAGVVSNRREGRTIWYRLRDSHVRMLLDLSREHVRHGSDGGR